MSDTTTPVMNQASYRESPYEDTAWEIVGEYEGVEEFLPLEIEVVERVETESDPMFANFGGVTASTQATRYHLPEGITPQAMKRMQSAAVQEEDPNLIKMTPAELEALLEKARVETRAELARIAEQAQREQTEQFQQRLGQVLRDMAEQIRENQNQIELQAVTLALEIGQKIVGHAVEINPEYISKIVNEALAQMGGARVRRIRVSPEDFEFIQVVGAVKLFENFDGSWTFEADPAIRSGCVVDSSAGEIDFRLDVAWERVRDNVLKVLSS